MSSFTILILSVEILLLVSFIESIHISVFFVSVNSCTTFHNWFVVLDFGNHFFVVVIVIIFYFLKYFILLLIGSNKSFVSHGANFEFFLLHFFSFVQLLQNCEITDKFNHCVTVIFFWTNTVPVGVLDLSYEFNVIQVRFYMWGNISYYFIVTKKYL